MKLIFGNTILLSFLFAFVIQFQCRAQKSDFPSARDNQSGPSTSLPFYTKANSSKDFHFKIKKPISFTLGITANPEWYAIIALPGMIDQENESNVEVFNGFFANSLALYLLNKEVGLDIILKKWENEPVSDNPENEMHRRLGKMFDTIEINKRMEAEITKLQQSQLPDGSWPWFAGMKSSRYITQLMCCGIGRLYDMHIYDNYSDRLNDLGVKAFKYIDNEMTRDYNTLVAQKANMDDNHMSSDIISYLYARTFWNVPIELPCERALYYWQLQAWSHWLDRPLVEKAMLVSAFYRQGEDSVYIKMFRAIDKQAIHNETEGVYWKENSVNDAQKARTQAMIIEAYNIMRFPSPDPETIDRLKQWLLAQRQEDGWASDMATAEAVYALNQNNYVPMVIDKNPKFKIGDMSFDSTAAYGTGFVYRQWTGDKINTQLAHIKVENTTDYPSFGDVMLQYKSGNKPATPDIKGLKINKKVYIMRNSSPSAGWKPLKKNMKLETGDSIKVSMVIAADKEFNYIRIQNMLSDATVISNTSTGVKKYGGLILDKELTASSINYYLEHLNAGKYNLNYTLSVKRSGRFQNGGATVDQMY